MKVSKNDKSNPFPPEIWIEIFNFIDYVDDVKNLTLVCKQFNEIVSKSDAMNLLTLRLHADMKLDVQNHQIIRESSRKYRSIQLHYFDRTLKLSAFSKITEKFGSNLRKLDIRKCFLTERELIEILKLCQSTLTDFHIRRTEIEKMSNYTGENFKLNKLKSLAIENVNCDIFSIIMNSVPDTLRHIHFECYSNPVIGSSSFAVVLLKQNNLKSLDISQSNHNSFRRIFNLDLDAFKNLKLETFSIYSSRRFDDAMDNNLLGFIKSQSANLKYLHLENVPVENSLEIFRYMPNLETLYIGNTIHDPVFGSGRNFRCPALKQIILEFSFTDDLSSTNCSKIIERFTNVNLDFINISFASSEMLQLITEMHPNLKQIEFGKFNDDSFKNVKFDNVEELIVSGAAGLKFKDSNLDFVFGAFKNLTILTILHKEQINSKALIWLLENFTKLEDLYIENGLQLKNLSKLSHHFNKLQILRIDNYGDSDIEEFRHQLRQFPDLQILRLTPKRPVSNYHYCNFSDSEDDEDF